MKTWKFEQIWYFTLQIVHTTQSKGYSTHCSTSYDIIIDTRFIQQHTACPSHASSWPILRNASCASSQRRFPLQNSKEMYTRHELHYSTATNISLFGVGGIASSTKSRQKSIREIFERVGSTSVTNWPQSYCLLMIGNGFIDVLELF